MYLKLVELILSRVLPLILSRVIFHSTGQNYPDFEVCFVFLLLFCSSVMLITSI